MDFLIEKCGLDEYLVQSCTRLVETYSEVEYRELARRKSICWNHITILLSVISPTKRAEFVERIEREGLSPRDLCELVATYYSNGWRPVRRRGMPGSVHEALDKLNEGMQKFLRLRGRLFGDRFDIPSAITNQPPEFMTQALRDQVAAAADGLAYLAKATSADACRLQENLIHLDTKLAAVPEPLSGLPDTRDESQVRKDSSPSEVLPKQSTALPANEIRTGATNPPKPLTDFC